jgi:hypothetical protein
MKDTLVRREELLHYERNLTAIDEKKKWFQLPSLSINDRDGLNIGFKSDA